MAIDHDQIFKRLIEAFFREFLELFCPAEERLIDFSRVEFLREEHFTDVERGLRRRLDLVARVGLKTGGEKFVLVHGEFEASRKERAFPRRMFQYFCQLFLRYDTEIVPIAVFTDDARWNTPVPDHFELSLAGKTFMRFEYHLVKLKDLDYRLFLKSNNPLAYGLMAKMEYNRSDRVRLKADFLRWILACPIDPARQSLLVEFVETYVALAEHEQAEFQQFVRNDPEYTKVRQMITTYEEKGMEKGIEKGMEKGIEKGIEKGRKKGKLEGRQEGKQEALILVLEKKFGKLSAARKRRVRQIESTPELESLLLASLDAASLEDLPL
jgi:hypothetical protein